MFLASSGCQQWASQLSLWSFLVLVLVLYAPAFIWGRRLVRGPYSCFAFAAGVIGIPIVLILAIAIYNVSLRTCS